ncbi:hypothetical protein FBR02_14650 [Anaerolineae bacterium CFX9]|nr:hypothetical protein [Anaerolineae bacterium CFX9]
MPDELDAVMDFVYGDEQPEGLSDSFSRALAQAYKDMELNENRSSFRGAQYLIAAPGDDELVSSFNARLPDNDDDHNITTRDIRPGVDIICMSDEPNSKLPIPLNRKPTTEEVKKYLQFRMVIHDTELVRALKALPLNPHWERIGGLRYARAVIFRDGKYEIPESGHRLKLTRSYGLEYIKEETV